MLKGLDLFSGIGGMSIALSNWVLPIAYCEIDPYCQSVLLSRMAEGSLPHCPIWDDIRTFEGSIFNGYVDIIYGGFPCQDVSIAGIKKGLSGERSRLVFELFRLVEQIKPDFIFLENVPQITSLGGNKIIKKVEEMGMVCRWACISAASCGAPHKRDRWFMLAHAHSKSSRKTYSESESDKNHGASWIRSSGQVRSERAKTYWQKNQCPFFGMDDGLPFEVDRARALGNAIVPQQAQEAFEILMGINLK